MKKRIKSFMMNKMAVPQILSIIKKENQISQLENVTGSDENSSERFEIVLEAIKEENLPHFSMKTLPHLLGSMRGMKKAISELKNNPEILKTHIERELFL